MDRGAWRATNCGVAKSQTQLSDQNFIPLHFWFSTCDPGTSTDSVSPGDLLETQILGPYSRCIQLEYLGVGARKLCFDKPSDSDVHSSLGAMALEPCCLPGPEVPHGTCCRPSRLTLCQALFQGL